MFKPLYGYDPEIVARLAEHYKMNPAGQIGPFYVGAIVDFFLAGIFLVQVYNYFQLFATDNKWVRRLVIVITFLSILKLFPSFYVVWDKHIVHYGDWANMVTVTWPLYTQAPVTTVFNLLAQMYFMWRCFNLTGRNWYLLGFVTMLMTADLGLSTAASIVYAYDPFNDALTQKIGVPKFLISMSVDLIITVAMSYQLLKLRNGFWKPTDAILSYCIFITWEAALPPTLTQLGMVTVFATMGKKHNWYLPWLYATPRIYAISLMYTLNSRDNVRHLGSNAAVNSPESHSYRRSSGINIHSGSQGAKLSGDKSIGLASLKPRDTSDPKGNSTNIRVKKQTITSTLGQHPRSFGGSRRSRNEDNESMDSNGWDKEPAAELGEAGLDRRD